MRSITFELTKVSAAITDKPHFRASVQTNATVGHEELASLMAARTKQEVALWKYFLDVLAEEIDTQLLDGNRIKLGRLLTGFAIRGTFTSEDEAFDPEKHRLVANMRLLDPLKSELAKAVPKNVTHGIARCSLGSAMDATTKGLSEVTGTNLLLIQGMGLGITPENPDEGVWLTDPRTGAIIAVAQVERSDDQTIDCFFPEPPAPGTYTLVISCRNGARETLSPAVAKLKNFTVKAPAH